MLGVFIGLVFGGILGVIVGWMLCAVFSTGAMADLRSEVIRLQGLLDNQRLQSERK